MVRSWRGEERWRMWRRERERRRECAKEEATAGGSKKEEKRRSFFLMPVKVLPTVSSVLIIVQAHYHFLHKIHFFT